MRNQVMYYTDYLTPDEGKVLFRIQQQLRQRRDEAAARNGTCPCRCKVPLDDDGTNSCGCCNEMPLEIPDGLI